MTRSDAPAPLTPAQIAALLKQKKEEVAKRANINPDEIQRKLAEAKRLALQRANVGSASLPEQQQYDARRMGRGGLDTQVHPSLQKDERGNLIVKPFDPKQIVSRTDFSTTKVSFASSLSASRWYLRCGV